ncbi:DNA excision repair protein ERCC-1 [Hyla sarda]|uniref:DNA excision repair protein ERCC-1 n=1 Tax=Hyla sarda TaxID=327740 RepID=UPI0024C2A6DA|nr:DNA excision repair protein ERCC-1 [Hyla sarda]XP_056387050.1 DNA excision repair protein ERCC-1 [Hyla sarda]
METPRGDPQSSEGAEPRRFIIPSQEPEAAPVRSLFHAQTAVRPTSVAPAGSYADYVFQKESKLPERRPQNQKSPGETSHGEPSAQRDKIESVPESKPQSGDSTPDLKEDPKTAIGLSVAPVAARTLKPGGGRSCIVVSPRQRGNPLLKHVRNIPWEFGEIVPDYLLGETCCALFLSLRYHNLNPEYIHTRLRSLGQSYALRVLLVQVDVKDPHFTLKELAKICILADCTLILSWSPEEAARYLETYKCYEQKPADALKERTDGDFVSKITDCLTTVKSVNKTDSATLLTTFGTLADLANASREDLSLCPGLGPQKAKRLFDTLHEPFLKAKK